MIAARVSGVTLHADAVRVLTEWTPPTPERATWQRFLDLLAADPGAVRRDHPGAHITASALVVDADPDRVLLCLHGRMHRWVQLGGHCEDRTTRPGRGRRCARPPRSPASHGLRLDPAPIDLDIHRGRLPVRAVARTTTSGSPRSPRPAQSSRSAPSPRRWAGSRRTRCRSRSATRTDRLIAPALARRRATAASPRPQRLRSGAVAAGRLSSSTSALTSWARSRAQTSTASGVSTTIMSRRPSVATSRPDCGHHDRAGGVAQQHRGRLGHHRRCRPASVPPTRLGQHVAERVEVADVGPAEVARHGRDQPGVGRALHHGVVDRDLGQRRPDLAEHLVLVRGAPGRGDRGQPGVQRRLLAVAARPGRRRPARRTCWRSTGSRPDATYAVGHLARRLLLELARPGAPDRRRPRPPHCR